MSREEENKDLIALAAIFSGGTKNDLNPNQPDRSESRPSPAADWSMVPLLLRPRRQLASHMIIMIKPILVSGDWLKIMFFVNHVYGSPGVLRRCRMSVLIVGIGKCETVRWFNQVRSSIAMYEFVPIHLLADGGVDYSRAPKSMIPNSLDGKPRGEPLTIRPGVVVSSVSTDPGTCSCCCIFLRVVPLF